jgi:Ion channel
MLAGMAVPVPGGASHRERYGLLLAAIVASFALEGIGSQGAWVQVLVTVLLAGTVLLALWAADVARPAVRLTAALALVVVGVSVVDAIGGEAGAGPTRVASALLVALAPPAVVLGVVRALRRHQTVTLEIVFGVLCLYLLLGLFFAFVFGAIDNLGGEPFFASGTQATSSRCVYFSFTTLTTVGYGDLTARSNLGHTLAVFEALLGQIYLVTVVSVIVGNLRRRATA